VGPAVGPAVGPVTGPPAGGPALAPLAMPAYQAWSGVWQTEYGTLQMGSPDGEWISGTYGNSFRISGKLSQNMRRLDGTWSEGGSRQGAFFFEIAQQGGSFAGRRWPTMNRATVSKPWTGRR